LALKLSYVGHRVDVEAGTDPSDRHSGGAKPAFGCLARARATPGYAGQRARRAGTQSQKIKATIIRRPQDSVPQFELFDCVGEVTRGKEGRVGAQSNGGVGDLQTTVQNGFNSGAEICPLLEPDLVFRNGQAEVAAFRCGKHGYSACEVHHDGPDILQHGGCKFSGQISTDSAGQAGLHSARNRRLGENTNRNAHPMRAELKFQPSILLTGATGLFGRACLSHLIARHGAKQILALVRRGRDTSELTALGLRSIEVDLWSVNLGLPDSTYRSLSESTKSIIHAAADIRFCIPLTESRRVNVLGTENMLRFAGHCARLERFAQISTVYVWGGKPGDNREEAAQPGPFFNSYQQTKFEAEQVTLAAMATVPAAIYRLSTMIYDGSAGRVCQFNYFHQLLRLAATNPLRAIPALPEAKIDLIDSDWAGRIFDFLFADRWRPGKIFHLCAGRQHSLRIDELFALTFDLLGLSATRPKIVTQDEFDRHASDVLSTPSRKQMWQSLTKFLPHMNVDQTFDCTRLNEALAHCDKLQRPDSRSLFQNALSYCIETRRTRSAQLNWPPQLEPAPAVQPKQ